jgi:hypothetical protein
MIELVDITEDTFKKLSLFTCFAHNSITTKIHALDNDVLSAKQCITCLNALLGRLYSLDKPEWLEQALVTRIYINGKYAQIQGTDGVKDIRRILDGIISSRSINCFSETRRNISSPLSNKAICSVQMVHLDENYSDTSYSGKYLICTSLNINSKKPSIGVH